MHFWDTKLYMNNLINEFICFKNASFNSTYLTVIISLASNVYICVTSEKERRESLSDTLSTCYLKFSMYSLALWHGDHSKKLHSMHSFCLRASNKPNVISPLSYLSIHAHTHSSDKCITKAKCCYKQNISGPFIVSSIVHMETQTCLKCIHLILNSSWQHHTGKRERSWGTNKRGDCSLKQKRSVLMYFLATKPCSF